MFMLAVNIVSGSIRLKTIQLLDVQYLDVKTPFFHYPQTHSYRTPLEST